MGSFRSFGLLKTLIIFNIIFLSLAIEHFQLEASIGGNVENPFVTYSALSTQDEENVPTTTFLNAHKFDASVFQTRLAHEKPDLLSQIGDKIDEFADALLYGELGRINLIKGNDQHPRRGPVEQVIQAVCSGITYVGLSKCPGNTGLRHTNNPSLIGTMSPKLGSLVKPSKVTASFIQTTSQ